MNKFEEYREDRIEEYNSTKEKRIALRYRGGGVQGVVEGVLYGIVIDTYSFQFHAKIEIAL